MAIDPTRPGYSVHVDGDMTSGARYVIRAVIAYEPEVTDNERQDLLPQAQVEALVAIMGQQARATRLGARRVRIEIDGDESLDRLFRAQSDSRSLRRALVG